MYRMNEKSVPNCTCGPTYEPVPTNPPEPAVAVCPVEGCPGRFEVPWVSDEEAREAQRAS